MKTTWSISHEIIWRLVYNSHLNWMMILCVCIIFFTIKSGKTKLHTTFTTKIRPKLYKRDAFSFRFWPNHVWIMLHKFNASSFYFSSVKICRNMIWEIFGLCLSCSHKLKYALSFCTEKNRESRHINQSEFQLQWYERERQFLWHK